MIARFFFVVVFLAAAASMPGFAVEPSEILEDSALEARARSISKGLRCVVCQNQSIDDSDAELARDLRVLVRERLVKGDSDQQVVDYIASRYGDFVLLKPPFKKTTYVLWLGPVVIAIFAFIAVFFFYRRKKAEETAPPAFSSEEQKRLDKLMGGKDT